MTSNTLPFVNDVIFVEYTSASMLLPEDFLANTARQPNSSAAIHARPMPDASMVRILLTPSPSNRRFHSRAIARNSPASI